MVASRVAPVSTGDPLIALANQLAELRTQVEEQGRRTLQNAAIGSGGITITGQGGISVGDANGVQEFYIGGDLGSPHSDGTPQQVTFIRDERGNARFAVWDGHNPSDPANQQMYLWDDLGNYVLATDDQGGIARPWIPMPTANVVSTAIPTVTTTSYTTLQSTGLVLKQQPSADVQALLLSNGGGAGNAQFTVNGTPVGSVIPIPANSFQWSSIQTLPLPGTFSSYVRVELQVQLTNATGSVGGVLFATQRQH